MTDSRYFSTTKKGEIAELKDELNELDKQKRKEAVKKVIAAMTVGKDVSMLFPDVINCMQTENLELKKLVYLYLINYSKSQPDLAIMAVNTFVKDTQDPNPLIRALAVRTMGCIRVDKITEYLCDPLERRLKDDDPYVRKTAAICVAKLYDISPELVQDRGFLDTLRELLSDANPMVVANAVASLAEIQDSSPIPVFQLSQQTVLKLLAALNECTEWGQVFILDALVQYTPKDAKEAESTIERVTPRLQHANSAVVLSAVKVILKQLDMITSPETIKALCKKMAPPLVTLLSAEPEIQYVALRNINLIIQRRPSILQHEIKVFFCKYNDPIYVKMEKLEIMIKLASDRNIDQVLLELKEYATEVDVEFVRKAVRAIGRCAITLERAAERCIAVLLELIQTKVNYVVQEAIVVIKDIFRRYPNAYERIIATLCENLDTLDEPEAKSSMIWIIGEYAERIENADELLEAFLETFGEENSMVQLQLLTATVKLFLKNCTESSQQMIQDVLNNATQETDNPDLRDRAFIYWRLLSTDPEAAKDVVLAEKPTITDDTGSLEGSLLNQLLGNISMLSSVYHKPPESFVSKTRMAVQRAEDFAEPVMDNGSESSAPQVEPEAPKKEDNVPDLTFDDSEPQTVAAAPPAQPPQDSLADLLGLDIDVPQPQAQPAAVAAPPAQQAQYGMDDLLGLGGSSTPAPTPAPAAGGVDDIFGSSFGGLSVSSSPPPPPKPVMLDASKGQGLEICGKLVRSNRQVFYDMTFTNKGQAPRDGFMIQFNKNTFGLTMAQQLSVPALQPNQSAETKLAMAMTGPLSPPPPNNVLQIAIKDNLGVYYCSDNIAVEALFQEDGKVDPNTLKNVWTQIPDANKQTRELQVSAGDPAVIQQKLTAANVFFILPGPNSSQFFSLKMGGNIGFIIELAAGFSGLTCSCKSPKAEYSEIVFDAIQRLLQ